MADDMWGTQLTDMWMAQPWMFDPSQKSNQFSQYNNARIPFPGSYNGAPTDAQGQPIQSFVDWQKANPGGMSINATPAQPAQQAAPNTSPFANVQDTQGMNAPATQQRGGLGTEAWGQLTPAQRAAAYGPLGQYQAGNAMMPSGGFVASGNNPSGSNPQASNALAWMNSGISGFNQMAGQQQPTPQQGQQGQQGAPPNNWQASLNALSNPGRVTTPGATVPLAQGSQPAGGVNQAWLQGVGSGQGMNQNFLSALRNIQGR